MTSSPQRFEQNSHEAPAPLRNVSLATFRFPGAISVHWFINLRWVAVLGQFVTILAVWKLFQVPLNVEPLLITVAVTAFSNLILMFWYLSYRRTVVAPAHSRLWHYVLAIVMAVDLILLTCLLYFSGGPTNPFWIFFFVNLCLAGVELKAGIAWCLNFLAVFCFAYLLFDHQSLDVQGLEQLLPAIRKTSQITLVHNGVFCAFITCASVIVSFSTLVTSRLRQRDEDLRLLESQRIRGEKLEALGTLAAGAAHELATPLGTIAVIVGELQHAFKNHDIDPQIREDVTIIRAELDRCRAILNHMSAQAGEGSVEKKINVTGAELLDLIIKEVKDQDRVTVTITPAAKRCSMMLEPYVTAQALRGMIKNALEASAPESDVRVDMVSSGNNLQLTVEDKGEGIPEHILSRVGEPFFTTKGTGKGMGLGIFLARTVVERLGGTMKVASVPGKGTTVSCQLPCQQNQ
ncbi:ATP-binding protein [Rubinisphaera italica]|uniref:histidine kinase n=1 Tax=Rubinisphaera italica TaxID=2527969 RepID=A0A5C5XM62_9PLAN|nr:ATP-binding protein [Rubinisphaera italica]TWT62822.1 Sensor histidine kinase RegB [Rubinisphaera italica]